MNLSALIEAVVVSGRLAVVEDDSKLASFMHYSLLLSQAGVVTRAQTKETVNEYRCFHISGV